MARLSIRQVEPLEMEFADGTIKEALFNNEAFMIYTEEFGAIDEDIENEIKVKPYEFVSKILYAGMKVMDKSITLNEAKSILIGGGTPLIENILNLLIDNFMSTSNEETKKKFFKEIDKFNKQIME